MDILIIFFMFILSLILIIKGGDWFVDSAVWIAKTTGLPNVLIGATIVSVATTLPELLVSSIATYNQHYDIAIGNVVGSIICNIGLVLGVVTILSPIKIRRKSFFIKGSFMLLSTIALLFFLRDTIITSSEGNIFLILFVIYILFNILELKSESRKKSNIEKDIKHENNDVLRNIIKFVAGVILIIIGAELLVKSGADIARLLKIPEQVISLTLISLGTSLPELITAISSVLKKQGGISIGNILGANTLNILMVLGVSSKIGDAGIITSYQNVLLRNKIYNIPQTLYLDVPISLVLMIILLLGGLTLKKIGRRTGVLILTIYILYLAILAKFFM